MQILEAAIPRVLQTQERLMEPLSAPERQEFMRLMCVLIEANAALSSTPTQD
jgi:hypothetical protein